MNNTREFFTFKMRAECISDVLAFAKNTSVMNLFITKHDIFPDVVVTFESDKTLHQIKKVLSKIEDGHVMVDTVNYDTGQR